jgi:predicted RND superfamily exporter protein
LTSVVWRLIRAVIEETPAGFWPVTAIGWASFIGVLVALPVSFGALYAWVFSPVNKKLVKLAEQLGEIQKEVSKQVEEVESWVHSAVKEYRVEFQRDSAQTALIIQQSIQSLTTRITDMDKRITDTQQSADHRFNTVAVSHQDLAIRMTKSEEDRKHLNQKPSTDIRRTTERMPKSGAKRPRAFSTRSAVTAQRPGATGTATDAESLPVPAHGLDARRASAAGGL